MDKEQIGQRKCKIGLGFFVVVRTDFIGFEFQVKYIWTSGRICDFKGCDRPDLLPTRVRGWFWTAELQKLAPTTDRQQNDWSENGGIGQPQPDNRVNIIWNLL